MLEQGEVLESAEQVPARGPGAGSAGATLVLQTVPRRLGARDRARRRALDVLARNDTGGYTCPSRRLYPHQWLWDSCFIAIGRRHVDPARAARELTALFRGQWPNGMIPHITFTETTSYHAGPARWRVRETIAAPPPVETSGITQCPLVAEAVVRVGETMAPADRHRLYRHVLPRLVRYHEWLYRERDPEGTGLVTLVHPWESGLDDTPPWADRTRPITPVPVRSVLATEGEQALDRARRDNDGVPPAERIAGRELFTYYELVRQLRNSGYDLTAARRDTGIPLLADVGFNAILIRANERLAEIAAALGEDLPDPLTAAARRGRAAFGRLWRDGFFHHRDARTGALVTEPTIAGLLALYSGAVEDDRAAELARALNGPRWRGRFGVTSLPTDHPAFEPRRYWHGPVWTMTNWLLADGLARAGRPADAAALRGDTIAMIAAAGAPYEYFSPDDGAGAGADDFAPTAALLLDLLEGSDR